jgi:hypothetical protein
METFLVQPSTSRGPSADRVPARPSTVSGRRSTCLQDSLLMTASTCDHLVTATSSVRTLTPMALAMPTKQSTPPSAWSVRTSVAQVTTQTTQRHLTFTPRSTFPGVGSLIVDQSASMSSLSRISPGMDPTDREGPLRRSHLPDPSNKGDHRKPHHSPPATALSALLPPVSVQRLPLSSTAIWVSSCTRRVNF